MSDNTPHGFDDKPDRLFDDYLDGKSDISQLYRQSRSRTLPDAIANKVLARARRELTAQPDAPGAAAAATVKTFRPDLQHRQGGDSTSINKSIYKSKVQPWAWALAASVLFAVAVYWTLPDLGSQISDSATRLARNENSEVGMTNRPPVKIADQTPGRANTADQDSVADSGEQVAQQQPSLAYLDSPSELTPPLRHNEPMVKQPSQAPVLAAPATKNTLPGSKPIPNNPPLAVAVPGTAEHSVAGHNPAPAINQTPPAMVADGDTDSTGKTQDNTPPSPAILAQPAQSSQRQPQASVAQATVNETPDSPNSEADDNADYSLNWMDQLALRAPQSDHVTQPTASHLAPDKWLEKIIQLHRQRQFKEAAADLAAFRKLYPHYHLPQWLQEAYPAPRQ